MHLKIDRCLLALAKSLTSEQTFHGSSVLFLNKFQNSKINRVIKNMNLFNAIINKLSWEIPNNYVALRN